MANGGFGEFEPFFKRGQGLNLWELKRSENDFLLLNLIIVTLKSKGWYNVHNVKNPLALIGYWCNRTKGSSKYKIFN